MEEKQSLVSAAPTEKPPLRDEENSSLLEAQPISMVVEDTTIKRRRRFLVGAATFALLFLLGIGLNMNRSAAASPEAQTLFADKIQDETTTNVTITTTTSAAATNDSNSSSSIDSGGVSENSSPSALKLTWCNVRANIVCILYKHRTNCLDESKHNCAPEVYPSPPKDYDDDNDDDASKNSTTDSSSSTVEDVKGLETGNSTATKNNSNKQDEENNSINGQGLDGSQSSYAKHDNDNEKYGIEETRSPMEDEGLIGWEQESQEWYNSSSAGSGSLTWDWVTANEEESENPQDAVKKVIENWSDSTDASEDAAMRAFINQYDFSGSTEE